MCCNEILNINLQNSDALTARVCLRRPTAKVKSMHDAASASLLLHVQIKYIRYASWHCEMWKKTTVNGTEWIS